MQCHSWSKNIVQCTIYIASLYSAHPLKPSLAILLSPYFLFSWSLKVYIFVYQTMAQWPNGKMFDLRGLKDVGNDGQDNCFLWKQRFQCNAMRTCIIDWHGTINMKILAPSTSFRWRRTRGGGGVQLFPGEVQAQKDNLVSYGGIYIFSVFFSSKCIQIKKRSLLSDSLLWKSAFPSFGFDLVFSFLLYFDVYFNFFLISLLKYRTMQKTAYIKLHFKSYPLIPKWPQVNNPSILYRPRIIFVI